MNRAERRKVSQECKREGHLAKVGDPRRPPFCARCGVQLDKP